MRVNRQQCQACGSRELNNLLVREAGEDTVVLVRCARCASLVARYRLNDYYHHGKGFESWLESYRGAHESGRDLAQRFEEIQQSAEAQFGAALDELQADGRE
ncbi:MAG: hypothetical protein AAGD10_09875 [Myxococcota bacterium]